MTVTALEELSSLYRISNGYHDIEGNYHPTSDETRRALLTAMGVASDNEAEVLDSLRRYRHHQWQRSLPAVKVFDERRPIEVPVIMSRDEQAKNICWVVESEEGRTYSGEFSPGNLDVLDETVVDNIPVARFNLRIEADLGTGYHWLKLENLPQKTLAAKMRLIITPERCYVPDEISLGKRFWGISLQLYSVRSGCNWGIGDFGDLITLVEKMSKLGCSCIGLNPLHALYPHHPNHVSPYSPSSRLFLNPLYIGIDAMEDFRESRMVRERVTADAFQQHLADLRNRPMVDYEAVAEVKYLILRQLYAHFHANHLRETTSRGREFLRYRKTQGDELRKHALFEARRTDREQSETAASRSVEFGPVETETVTRVNDANSSPVEFYEYLQWQAETQLSRAYRTATDCGLAFSLYQDLAVGCDLDGSDTCANPTLYGHSAHIGSPPDAFSPTGQDWSLAPYIPHHLEDLAYAPFIELLRRNMLHAGVLRIDHVMGMHRLFWVPEDKDVPGAYVDYPMHDLQGILALESQRNRCLIIGEDLGTVSDDLRSAMSEREIFSYKVFYFEKDWHGDHSYMPIHSYAEHSLVTVTTHDLPTLAGFWRGTDLKLRDDLGLFLDAADRENQYSERSQDRARLIDALEKEGLWEGSGVDSSEFPTGLKEALHTFLARSPAALMMIQLDDMLQLEEQVNVPGTTLEYPNWRRKLPLDVKIWSTDTRVTGLADRVHIERSRAVSP